MSQSPTLLPVVLSVDDEASIQSALKRCLGKLEIELLIASSGAEGLDIVKARPVDVIITDMQMPSMDGAEFLARAAAEQPQSARILLTGQADIERISKAINAGGVSSYISKPWADDELLRVVKDAIEKVRLRRENAELLELTSAQNAALKALNEELELRVEERTAQLSHLNDMLSGTVAELEDSYETMVDLLANISCLPNPESESAARKIALALTMAEELEIDEEAQQHIANATRLHRIGWVAIPKTVTNTPTSVHSATQTALFQQHPIFGEAVLLGVPRLQKAAKIVRCQHEHYDGSGFPDRLAADGIPLASRILAVARDYYDYLSGRIESSSLVPADAYAKIIEGEECEYDPVCVAAFRKVLPSIAELDPHIAEIRVEPRLLLTGMKLTRDIASDSGAVLLIKGQVLNDKIIETLINLERRSDHKLSVFVVKEANEAKQASK